MALDPDQVAPTDQVRAGTVESLQVLAAAAVAAASQNRVGRGLVVDPALVLALHLQTVMVELPALGAVLVEAVVGKLQAMRVLLDMALVVARDQDLVKQPVACRLHMQTQVLLAMAAVWVVVDTVGVVAVMAMDQGMATRNLEISSMVPSFVRPRKRSFILFS